MFISNAKSLSGPHVLTIRQSVQIIPLTKELILNGGEGRFERQVNAYRDNSTLRQMW